MKMEMDAIYIGMETRVSNRTGNQYTVFGLMQGFQSEELFATDDTLALIKELKPNSKVHVEANVTINGDKSRMSITNIVPADTK